MGERLEQAFADIRTEIAEAKAEREKAGLIAATIWVNATRLGATNAEIDAMVRGETNFVNFMIAKIERMERGELLRALLRRAHDAMSRRDPDGISTEAWDQLVADMAKELGVGNG